jgi:hypothetical protein
MICLILKKFEKLTHYQSVQTQPPSQEVFHRCEAVNIQLKEEGEPNYLAYFLEHLCRLEMS